MQGSRRWSATKPGTMLDVGFRRGDYAGVKCCSGRSASDKGWKMACIIVDYRLRPRSQQTKQVTAADLTHLRAK